MNMSSSELLNFNKSYNMDKICVPWHKVLGAPINLTTELINNSTLGEVCNHLCKNISYRISIDF